MVTTDGKTSNGNDVSKMVRMSVQYVIVYMNDIINVKVKNTSSVYI